jgi:pimeloyl-ACP methyl ester carboxylesterase
MKRSRFVRIGMLTAASVVGLVLVLVTGLALWGGGANLDPHRQLLPGVRLDLRTTQTARGPVEYDLAGDHGPVVLSVQAGLGGADQARLFADWLRPSGVRILSPSRPGYLGTPLASGRSFAQQADLLAALLDRLDIKTVGLFASSAGAPVAYTFAALHPDRVWGLVAVDGQSRAVPDSGSGSALRHFFTDKIAQKLAVLTAKVSLSSVISSTLDEASTFTADQKKQRVDYIVGHPEVRALFEAMFATTFPYEQRMPGTRNDEAQVRTMNLPLDRIATPALIVHGTRDGDVPFEDGVTAAARIPGAQHYWMSDDDHLGFWLSPHAAAAQSAVRDFLREHAPMS